jgi:hypothetical protein
MKSEEQEKEEILRKIWREIKIINEPINESKVNH